MHKNKPPESPQAPADAIDEPAESGFIRGGETSDGGSFVPDEGRASRHSAPVTQIGSSAAFQLAHSPNKWTVLDGHIVPAFGKLHYIAGVNNVDERIDMRTGRRTLLVGPARAERESRGEILIPFDAIPASHIGRADLHQSVGAAPSYLWRPRGRPDATLLIYERCYPGSKKKDTDSPRYIEFCENLIATGVIKPCPAFVLRDMLQKAQERLERVADIAARYPSYAGRLTHARGQIDILEVAIAERDAEVVRVPETGDSFAPGAGA